MEGQDFTLPLWTDNIPNYQEIGEHNILVTDADHEHYSQIVHPELSVFLPSKQNATGQAILIIPGGGYNSVVHVWEGTDVAKWFNANGIAAIVLAYRMPKSKSNIEGHKSPLLDASRAMRLIRTNAADWNIKSNNLGVIGFSVGGHVASTLGTHYSAPIENSNDKVDLISARPDFMVLVYPVISMSANFTHFGSKDFFLGENPNQELMEYYSNEKHITENTPPTFLIHTSDDAVVHVDNSIAFYKGLIRHKVEAEMHIFKHGEHGFSLANKLGNPRSWKTLCVEWMRGMEQEFFNR